MAESDKSVSQLFGGFIDMPRQHVVQITLLGAVLGAATWIVALLIRQVVLMPLFCGDSANGTCPDVTTNATNISLIVTAVIGLLGLVRLSVYRPLLIVLAVIASLWGVGAWTVGSPWYEALAWLIILCALCYVAFAWLVRPRSFVPAVILVVIAVVLIRWLPMV